VTAGEVGQTTAKLTFTCTTTFISEEKEFEIIVAKLQLKELSYSGEAYQEVSDDSGGQYEAPHWQDNSEPPDGDASDPPAEDGSCGDHRFPVSFRRDTKIKVSAKFTVMPEDLDLDSVLIRGRGSNGINFPETQATVSGGEATVDDVEMETKLEDVVAFHNPLVVNWEVSVDEGLTWAPAGTSDNRVYVTLAKPIVAEGTNSSVVVYESVMEIASRNVVGATDQLAVPGKLWQDFNGPIPGVKRKLIDGYNIPDGMQMKYWLDASHPNVLEAGSCQTVRAMLDPDPERDFLQGVGTCRAWSSLFIACLRSQGVKGAEIMRVFASDEPERVSLLVKDWTFVGSGTAPSQCEEFTHLKDVDVLDKPGLPGQGVENPIANFTFHFIVRIQGEFFDPSYGSGPYSGLTEKEAWADWEADSISGFTTPCGRNRTAARKNVEDLGEIVILPDLDQEILSVHH